MNAPVLYRKRLIPEECIRLDKDKILVFNGDHLITSWKTIRPKKTLSHGCSAYFWKKGFKLSKFYDHDGQLMYWYCDIITHTYDEKEHSYVITDLLADVLIYPNGRVEVVDLDELADSLDDGLLTPELLKMSLRQLNWLLNTIYSGKISKYQHILEHAEKTEP